MRQTGRSGALTALGSMLVESGPAGETSHFDDAGLRRQPE